MKNWLIKRKRTRWSIWKNKWKKNPKNINPEELCPYEYSATERKTWQSAEFYQGQFYNRNYSRIWQVASNSRIQSLVPSVDPYGDPSSVPSYVPSVNPPRARSEQYVGDIQEERWTTLEQLKSLENIIASGDIKVYKSDQLQEFVVFACWRLM